MSVRGRRRIWSIQKIVLVQGPFSGVHRRRRGHNMLIVLIIRLYVVYYRLERLLAQRALRFNLKTSINCAQSGIFCKKKLTFDHSSRHLKQNSCIHESEKHLLLQDPRQIAQFGGVLEERLTGDSICDILHNTDQFLTPECIISIFRITQIC